MNSIFMKSGQSETSEIVKPLRLSGVQDCFGCFSPIFLNMIKKICYKFVSNKSFGQLFGIFTEKS